MQLLLLISALSRPRAPRVCSLLLNKWFTWYGQREHVSSLNKLRPLLAFWPPVTAAPQAQPITAAKAHFSSHSSHLVVVVIIKAAAICTPTHAAQPTCSAWTACTCNESGLTHENPPFRMSLDGEGLNLLSCTAISSKHRSLILALLSGILSKQPVWQQRLSSLITLDLHIGNTKTAK